MPDGPRRVPLPARGCQGEDVASTDHPLDRLALVARFRGPKEPFLTLKSLPSRLSSQRFAIAGMAIIWLAMALHGAWVKSPVMDEPAHIGDGHAILGYGDFRFNPEHPPLFKVASVLPAFLLVPSELSVGADESQTATWRTRDQSLWGYGVLYLIDSHHRIRLFLCRLIPILTGLLGGLLAYAWGRELKGRTAGLMAMGLLMFYPEYLGHSRFVTLDVPTLVCVASLTLVAWRMWQKTTVLNTSVFVSVCLIGSLVKLPVTVAVIVVWLSLATLTLIRTGRKDEMGLTLRQFMFITAVLFAGGVFTQWAAAGFRFTYETDIVVPLEPRPFMRPETWQPPLGPLLHLLNDRHLLPQTTIAVLAHTGTIEGRPVFLLGEDSFSGWYHYFAVTTALKTPFWHLLLLPLAAGWTGWRFVRGTVHERMRLALFLPPFLIILIMTMFSRLNIGHRHILFIYFPWCVLAGAALADVIHVQRQRIVATGAVVGLCLMHVLLLHPHHATYLNALGGGDSLEGRQYLSDSNVDWGQDLGLAVDAVIDMGFLEANVAYYGMGRPEAYGLDRIRIILPNYPWMLRFQEAESPDARLPTIVSVNALHTVNTHYPGGLQEEPAAVCNSVLVFPPRENR